MSDLLVILIKVLNYVGLKLYQKGFICKALEATGTEHCNEMITSTRIESHIRTDDNDTKAKIYCTNSYVYIMGMMLYLESNTRP